MGKAFVGLSDDGNGLFINPAGLAGIKSLKLTSMYTTLFTDVTYIVAGGAYPTPIGPIGLGIINVSTGSIPITTLTGGVPVQTGTAEYASRVVMLSYAKDLGDHFDLPFVKDTSVGASIKYFTQGFSGSATVDSTGSGFDLDLGLQYRALPWLTAGLAVQNALPASMGGVFKWSGVSQAEESIPSLTKVGANARLIGETEAPWTFGEQMLNVGLDLDMALLRSRPAVAHLGVEYWPFKMLALRAGIDQKPAATIQNNLAAGIGLKYGGFTFDYAYHQLGDVAENVYHLFSIGYVGAEEKTGKAATLKSTFKPTVRPRVALKSFSDVPSGYWAKDPIEYLATAGIIGGYPDGTFQPDKNLTRAELCTLLVKAKGISVSSLRRAVFPDVPASNWAAPYIKEAVDLKIVSGYPDGSFRPNNPLSRAEAIIIIARFDGLEPPPSIGFSPFPDVKNNHWAAPAISVAKNAGLIEYLVGKNFEPNRGLTRAEAAEIISKTKFGKEKIRGLF